MRITIREEDLAEEAAGVVRQAVTLARRRDHAHVTPLHLASAILSASPHSSLRAACVSSQPHPLQHNALELSLDVALGRLAAPTHHRVDPAASNAFCAALRRAQRLGAVDKVELQHLAVSVLDDPGVDRVMREAGFSTAQLRACVLSSQTQSHRAPAAGYGVASLDPAPGKIGASGGQPSLRAVGQELPRSQTFGCGVTESSQLKLRPTLAATTAILPPWLRRHQDTITTGATRCGFSSLPVPDDTACGRPRFTELNAQNLKILCDTLELRCPRHADTVPGISTTVLWFRSGMTRNHQTTWLLFLGKDSGGKMAIARELAKLVFGSYTDFAMVSASDIPTPRARGKLPPKRLRSLEDDERDGNGGYVVREMFFEAILENPHRVILIDGVDGLDRDSEMRIEKAVTEGAVVGSNGDIARLEDAIVVLDSRSVVSSPRVKRRLIGRQDRQVDGDTTGKEKESCPRLSLDLNAGPEDWEDNEEVNSADDAGILNVVDGVFFFN